MKNKLTKCKSCGAEVASSAKSCPSCGAKLKKPVVLIVLAVFLGICIIAAIFGSGDDSGPKKVDDPAPPPSQSVTPEQTSFAVGEKVELDDIIVTLDSVTENSGSQFNKPAEGNVFLLCQFNIENNSEREIAVSSMLSFSAYVDDYASNLSLTAMISSDQGQLDGSVAAGKKIKGVVGYEVPSDWAELEVRFTPDFWSGKDITFVAAH